MADNPGFADTLLPIRNVFIVSGDFVIDPEKVVAVSSVYPCAQTMSHRFTVLMLGGHEIPIAAETSSKPGTFNLHERQRKETWALHEDFLIQWRNLRLSPS